MSAELIRPSFERFILANGGVTGRTQNGRYAAPSTRWQWFAVSQMYLALDNEIATLRNQAQAAYDIHPLDYHQGQVDALDALRAILTRSAR